MALGRRPAVLAHASCDARIINLETSITTSDDYVPGKAVHYRMNPANSEALAAVRPDVCVLANNHVLDFGPAACWKRSMSSPHLGLPRSVPDDHCARLSRR